ncbi:lytic transglycosylase domain-containing protein [Aquabacterium sp. A08]|uniref:lytic transglycosylase domain-containing protein n=1 Tax=Aquabacterium sp. A08 TaxID=2718532 RepID=UPI00142302B4|nr:lytic transglycosylase domain-containing protein [Aquabacterium sp. A08]NIC43416.1 lytic transglycosylase domain-containing protein [Aquabacterium sp. A08]
MTHRVLWGWCCLAILCGSAWATALPDDGPPEWTDEPPRLSRWIEEGHRAQQQRDTLQAATRYCSAARYGSVEAQYRLGRLYLERRDAPGQAEARAVLAIAAQRGHEKAAALLGDQPAGDALPDCLLTGRAPDFEVPPLVEPAVPTEVVERYMLALPQDKRRHALLIQRLAPRFDVDYRLALAIARAESNLDPRALSPKNAQGLMQLIPDTAARFGVRNAFDPEQNVRGGLAYLRWLLERFNGNVALASAAYNAGEGAVDRHGGVPPYAETREYVQRILHFYRSPVHARPGAL